MLLTKVWCLSLESKKQLCLMTLKIDTKFEGKLTCASKNDMRNLANFHQSTQKSQNWDFNRVLLSKVENVRAESLQGIYVSWQWRMIQNLKKNWLVYSKLTWGIWRILTRVLTNLKHFHFSRVLFSKVYNVWAKKVRRSYVWWHWILMQKFSQGGSGGNGWKGGRELPSILSILNKFSLP